MSKLGIVMAAVTVTLVACGSSNEPTESEPAAATQSEELRSCVQTALCIQGYEWSQKSCSCVPTKVHGSSNGGGAECGSGHCGAGQYCCNASCGICAPIGSVCIQIACTTL